MHFYTLIQIACLAMLYGVKSVREAALAFPFVLMFLVPIRSQLKRCFTDSELEAVRVTYNHAFKLKFTDINSILIAPLFSLFQLDGDPSTAKTK